MISEPRERKFYYGWTVLAAVSGISFANAVTSIGVLTVFFLPMSEELGWNRTQVSGATSVGAILGALAAVTMGRLSDRAGARAIMSLGAILITLAMLGLSAVTGLIGFYVAFGVARMCDQGFIQAVAPPTIGKWFEARRGRAMSILFFATSAGGIVMPLLVQAIIQGWDWRWAWGAMAVVMALVGLLPVALLVRRSPESMGLQIDGSAQDGSESKSDESPSSDDEGLTMAEALRTGSYWLILGSVFVTGAAGTGINLHMVPYLVGQGLDANIAVGAVSVNFLSSAVGGILAGVLTERFPARMVLAVVYGLRTVSVAILIAADTVAEAYGFAILRGATEGGLAAVGAILLAEYFGRRSLGGIYGLNRALLTMGFAVGPVVAGAAYDLNGNYEPVFWAFLVMTGLSALMIAIARPPRRPAMADGGRLR